MKRRQILIFENIKIVFKVIVSAFVVEKTVANAWVE